MGKKLDYFITSEVEARAHVDMSREQFVRIVGNALANHPHIDSDIAHRIRSMAQTTSKIDFNAWKCFKSCGCPLTKIGVVRYKPSDDFNDNTDVLKEHGRGFPGSFDTLMSKATGVYEEATATIID